MVSWLTATDKIHSEEAKCAVVIQNRETTIRHSNEKRDPPPKKAKSAYKHVDLHERLLFIRGVSNSIDIYYWSVLTEKTFHYNKG